MDKKIRYRDGSTALTGVFAVDRNRTGARPGILVVHGGAGLDLHAEDRARRFAEDGYVAFACDMFGDGVAGDRQRVMSCINELRGDRQKLTARARAGIDILLSHPTATRQIAVVGYCFGGLVALELARAGVELGAAVSVHGSVSTNQPAVRGHVRTPILVCHGALDPYNDVAQLTRLIEEMNGADADWQLVCYGGAMHGFTHHAATGQTPGVLYDERADARSRRAILAFLADAFAQHEA
ncbi:MAG TPA: dienelactone hydrolase family protein [Vicinamibacterales bacterium]|nr:dienelactone hydrolase family protein [Vicinamibacterales bacterium]